MQITISDINVIGETEATIFSMIGSTTDALIMLTNLGTNTINYRFQYLDGATWTDLVADPDGELYATLMSGETRNIKLTVAYQQVRLVANASGGSSIWLGINRWALRAEGGALPILSF